MQHIIIRGIERKAIFKEDTDVPLKRAGVGPGKAVPFLEERETVS